MDCMHIACCINWLGDHRSLRFYALASVGAFFNLGGFKMKEILTKLSDMGIGESRIKIIEDNAIQILKEHGCLIVSKTGENKHTIVSILEEKSQKDVLEFIKNHK